MNNFVFSQDPLLFQSYQSKPSPEEYEMKQKQLNDMVRQYQQMQQPPTIQNDYLSELDTLMRGMPPETAERLSEVDEYVTSNAELQGMIQEEIMNSIKWKLNSNPKAVAIMEKLKGLINKEKVKAEEEERKNISEINDYMRNYSNMTFDEYKKIKEGKI